MEYTYFAPPEKANAGWMGYHMKLQVVVDRREEFWAFLENYCGPKGVDWRLDRRQTRWIWGSEPIQLRFRHKKHAMVVKLQWEEDEDPMEVIYAKMKALSARYGIASVQSQGRGLRNVHVSTTAPTANPMPWYGSTDLQLIDYSGILSRKTMMKRTGLSGVDIDSIFLDEFNPAPTKPVWHVDKCRERGDRIMTTEQIKARLAASSSEPTLNEVRPGERRDSGSDRTSG